MQPWEVPWQLLNKAITFLTSLSSLILCNLHLNNNAFSSLLSSSFLQPMSPLTATPATVLLPTYQFPANVFLNFPMFLHAAFPPVHHTSDACSRQGLASYTHISLPLSTSISSFTLPIQPILAPHFSAFSLIFSKYTFHLIPLSNHTTKYLNTSTFSILSSTTSSTHHHCLSLLAIEPKSPHHHLLPT